MTLKVLQNFYKATIMEAFDAGDLKVYVDILPTPTSGYLVINPSNSSKREIVLYSAIGTDGGGNFLTLTTRGIGVSTDQAHDINEPVRMNITAEHYAEIQDDLSAMQTELDNAILAGAGNASTTTKGISKLSVAPVSATEPIAVGDNDSRLVTAIETTTGVTHSLTTTAGQRVVVWVKGTLSGAVLQQTVTLAYNAVAKDTCLIGTNSNDNGTISLMYTEIPSAGTQNITVTTSAGSINNCVIIVMKIG